MRSIQTYQHSCSCTAYGVVQYETRSNSTLLPYMYESSWLCVSPILCSSDYSLVCALVRVCSAANPRTNSTVFWLIVRGSTSLLDAQPLLMCPICRICPTLNSLLSRLKQQLLKLVVIPAYSHTHDHVSTNHCGCNRLSIAPSSSN